MKSPETLAAITGIANEFGLEPAALLAICQVESGGKVFTRIDGRLEPLIRFEGHYFDRRLAPEERRIARSRGLASARAGAIPNPRAQSKRWTLLRKAEAINRRAARESVSWGIGQVMGAHWAWLGFGSIDELVDEARSGAAGQVRLMVKFITKVGLVPAIKRHDWATFARGYNGPAYRKYRYDTKLAAAYGRFNTSAAENGNTSEESANQGHVVRSSDVRSLQRKLSALGYPLDADGIFGPATRAAVKQFQKRNGLTVTGIADDATLVAIDRGLPLSAGSRWIAVWFSRALRLVASFFGFDRRRRVDTRSGG